MISKNKKNKLSNLIILAVSFVGFFFLGAKDSYAMTINKFLYKPDGVTYNIFLEVSKTSGDMATVWIAAYDQNGKYIVGSANVETFGLIKTGDVKLQKIPSVEGTDFGKPNGKIVIYNCTSNACSGSLGGGLFTSFDEVNGIPKGTYKTIGSYDVDFGSVYCSGTCPTITGKEYNKDSNTLVIHHNNPYDAGVCGDDHYAAYALTRNGEVSTLSKKLEHDMVQESGANNCRSEMTQLGEDLKGYTGTVEIVYYWTEYKNQIKPPYTTKNFSGAYYIGGFVINLDEGTIGSGGDGQDNADVSCYVIIGGEKLEGVSTAIGCLPVTSEGIVTWVGRFGMIIGSALAVFKIILGSISVMTSTGNPDKLQEGKEDITSAIIGLIVIACAALIFSFLGINILNLNITLI